MKSRRIQTRGVDPRDGVEFAKAVLLFLRVPHAQYQQIFILEVIARDGVAVREHLSVVREDDPSRGQRAISRRDDAVAECRDEQVQRQFRDHDDRTIQLPLGLAGVRR